MTDNAAKLEIVNVTIYWYHISLSGRIPPSIVSLTLGKTEEKVDDGDCRYQRVHAHVFFIRTEFEYVKFTFGENLWTF